MIFAIDWMIFSGNLTLWSLFIFLGPSSDDCHGSDGGMPTTPLTGASASGVHHGDLLTELKPTSFAIAGQKILLDDGSVNSLMGSSRCMSSLMASQFGTKDHAASVLHLPSTAFASYHPGAHYDSGSVATLANLHAHQHVQSSALYHGHRDQAFSHA